MDGTDIDEFIRNNADPIWLHQNEMWEELYELESEALVDLLPQGGVPGSLESDDSKIPW